MTKKFPLTNWSEKKAFTIKLGAVKKYHIAVFADPNCPWCKRFFEENTDKLNDLEIFVYLAPVLGEDSEKLSAEILSENVNFQRFPTLDAKKLVNAPKMSAHHRGICHF